MWHNLLYSYCEAPTCTILEGGGPVRPGLICGGIATPVWYPVSCIVRLIGISRPCWWSVAGSTPEYLGFSKGTNAFAVNSRLRMLCSQTGCDPNTTGRVASDFEWWFPITPSPNKVSANDCWSQQEVSRRAESVVLFKRQSTAVRPDASRWRITSKCVSGMRQGRRGAWQNQSAN